MIYFIKKILKIKYIIILTTFLITCQELYDPKETETNKKIPVITGHVFNDTGPHIVNLNWAVPFNSTEVNPDPITNAAVILNDDTGNSIMLRETTSGEYSTSNIIFL